MFSCMFKRLSLNTNVELDRKISFSAFQRLTSSTILVCDVQGSEFNMLYFERFLRYICSQYCRLCEVCQVEESTTKKKKKKEKKTAEMEEEDEEVCDRDSQISFVNFHM